ncbi:polysaccharide biosynthesis tyrosine autokinase [Ornithinimicrobium sp. Y1847]|uniref:polysaccharide biosynthesis tyrosine autokinase n=1 Tax=Ornithinimicrobium sp. Y1847 TaxID=3405419 RepID=UPI003B674DBB
MDVQDLLRLIRRHWRMLVLTTLLGIAAAAIYTMQQPAVFASTASGFVRAPIDQANPGLGQVSDNLAKSRAQTYVRIAESAGTAQRVIDELGLDTSAAALAGQVTVTQPTDTVYITVTARSATPQDAQAIANSWVRATAEEVAFIETGQEGGTAPLTVIPVEQAALSSTPVSPDPQRNILIGGAIGLVLGAIASLLRNQIDRRLRSKAEIERRFGLPVIGSIPRTGRLDAPRDSFVELVTEARNPSRAQQEVAESFRKLRTNLQFLDVDDPPRIVVVSSPFPGDGKSTIAANLAATIALGGQPVMLVEGDLRRPTVADKFGLVEGGGLTDLLIGRADVEDVVQTTPRHPGLGIIAAGSIPPNPSEILGSRAMGKLLQDLAQDHVVIVDAPPLLPVTDAALLATNADGVVVCVSAGRTLDTDLEDALGALQRVRGKALGVIINRVPQSAGERGHYGGYYGTYYTNNRKQKGFKGRGRQRFSSERASARAR